MATSAHLMFGTTAFAEISWLSAFDHRCGNDWSTEATFRLACTAIGPGSRAILIGIPSANGSVIRMCWSATISSNGRWVFPPKLLRASMDPCARVGPPRTPVSLSTPFHPLARAVVPVPSGESPDGTGGSPVLPANHFSNTLLASEPGSQAQSGAGDILRSSLNTDMVRAHFLEAFAHRVDRAFGL